MSKKSITAAATVIGIFGGVRPTARAIGLAPASVCNWKKRGGGAIPGKHWAALLKAAGKAGLKLKSEQLYHL